MMQRYTSIKVQHLFSCSNANSVQVKVKAVNVGQVEHILLLVRNDASLLCYKYISKSEKWEYMWNEDTVFDDSSEIEYSPWLVSDDGFIIIRTMSGIQLYRLDEQLNIEYLATDGRYHDVYGWNQHNYDLLFGHFYTDPNKIGVISRYNGNVTFEVVIKEDSRRSQFPVWRMDSDPRLSRIWKHSDTLISLAYVDHTEQQAFVLRTSEMLSIFKLEENGAMKKVFESNSIPFSGSGNDKVVFGKLSFEHQHMYDILHFNETGMTGFQFVPSDGNFKAVLHMPQFAKEFGWRQQHMETIILNDIDGDGLDEIVYNGPTGINTLRVSFASSSAEHILSEKTFNVSDRHSKSFAIAKLDNRCSLISISENNISVFKLVLDTSRTTEKLEIDQNLYVNENSSNLIDLVPQNFPYKLNLSLHDQLDYTDFLYPRNPLLGILDFSIPLIKVPNFSGIEITLSLKYKEHSYPDVMGSGWSLPVDCIYVDRRGSIFPAEHEYYIVRDGVQSRLTPKSEYNLPALISYELKGSTDINITFYKDLNFWRVQTIHETFQYGSVNNIDWIQWEPGSDDWPIADSSETPVTIKPSVWYLGVRYDNHTNYLKYIYRPTYSNLLSGEPYIQRLNLLKISSSNNDVVRLTYDNRYNVNLLTGYTIDTKQYMQKVEFGYSVVNFTPKLVSIVQLGTSVLQFRYDGPKGEMSEIYYPNGLVAKFNYDFVTFPNILHTNIFKYNANVQIEYGPSYMIVGGKTSYEQVSIEARDVIGLKTTQMSSLKFPLLGKEPVVTFKIYTNENFFVVELIHSVHKELCLFHKHSQRWTAEASYMKMIRDSSLITGKSYVLIRSTSKLAVLQRLNSRWDLKPLFSNLSDDAIVKAFSHAFVIYNNGELTIGFRNVDGIWTKQIVTVESDLLKSSLLVFDKFDIDSNTAKCLREIIREGFITIHHNAIVVRSVALQDMKLFSTLSLKVFNHKYDLLKSESVTILIEDLDEYLLKLPAIQNTYFELGYELHDKKLKLSVKQHTGFLIDEVNRLKENVEQEIRNNESATDEEKRRYREESHERITNELREIYKNITTGIKFAIDPSKFGVFANDNSVVSASHNFKFNGVNWKYNKIPESEINLSEFHMQLSKTLHFSKAGLNDTYQLHSNEKVIWDSKTGDGSNIIVSYPTFIGAQKPNASAEIFVFDGNKTHKLPQEEIISRLSNHLALITVSKDQKTATVRTAQSLKHNHQSVIIQQEVLLNDNERRRTMFEYDSMKMVPFTDGFIFTGSKIIPGGRPDMFGWYQENYNLLDAQNSTKMVYNSAGQLVKVVENNEKIRNKTINNDGVLLNRSNTLIVADFRPFKMSDEVTSYYGFEPYEINRIGLYERWNYDNSMVMQESSGHFLRMNSNSSITADLEPKVSGLLFIFSCWTRKSQFSPTPIHIHLKLVGLGDETLEHIEGKIHHKNGDWYYVEALLNSKPLKTKVKIHILIKNNEASYVDVDHLRITPSNFHFKANIYDARNGKLRAILNNSGNLRQVLFDAIGNEICTVSEKGIVEQFTFNSRNFPVQRNSYYSSRVEMHPAYGVIDETSTKDMRNLRIMKSVHPTENTFSVRFLYQVSGKGSIFVGIDRLSVRINRAGNNTQISVNHSNPYTVVAQGECTILFTRSFVITWIQGHLISETRFIVAFNNQTTLSLNTTGVASLSEIIYLYDPTVKVYYMNKLGLPVQEITLKDHDKVNIRQILYDELDRPVMKTKWTEIQASGNDMLNYNFKFITNLDRVAQDRTTKGLVNLLNPDCEGFPYTWISYQNNPLEEQASIGLPGKLFSKEGPYSTKFGSNPSIAFLKLMYPVDKGFKHEFELNSAGSLMIQVFDRHRNIAAELVKVINHDHRLTTFEYDSHDKLLLRLPPIYHVKANSFSRLKPFSEELTTDEVKLRCVWGTHFRYNSDGRLVAKISPDAGQLEYYYTPEGLLRFVIHGSLEHISSYVKFYSYDFEGKVTQKGLVDIPRHEIKKYLENSAKLPTTSNFVRYDFGDNELVSLYRNRVYKSLKFIEGVKVKEALVFDDKKRLLSKIFVSNNNSLSLNYKYQNLGHSSIEYPFLFRNEQLKIFYHYNMEGKINEIRVAEQVLIKTEYNAFGGVKGIIFEPQSEFTYERKFGYNAPGYLSSIEDPFLIETVQYISDSYGGKPLGNGTVSATIFNATWHERSDISLIKLSPKHFLSNDTSKGQASMCFAALEKLMYLDECRRPRKSFYPASETAMPLICNTGGRADHISSVLVSKGFPLIYGHRYDYENHKQLIKAKYFQSSDEIALNPLTEESFAKKMRSISTEKSRAIWNELKRAGFIITDCTNSKICHALPGKSLFHPTIASHMKAASLENLFANAVSARKDLSQETFSAICHIWHEHDALHSVTLCKALWNELLSSNFVGSRSAKSTKALSPDIKLILKDYPQQLSGIIYILYDNFSKGLGKSPGDVQSYDIDPNGNHVLFYTGLVRYRMEYIEHTNKLAKVFKTDLRTEAILEEKFLFEHDSEGSVTKAAHKKIERIMYDPLSRRATRIEMSDGRRIHFRYDIRGGRIFKQVVDKNGFIVKDKYYIRDLNGKCLIEHESTYFESSNVSYVLSTAYVYLGDTLVGFIRNEQFYSVYLDHEGSVRLVIKNGEVVAAYDYLPYGQILRHYNSDPQGDIVYRYTGQEWDEETGLYNFHARIYDPEVGRFYQIDPKEQYPSPYVYAGNSPISMIDPDGQFAFLIPVAFAVLGGYLGASAANKSFNPVKWKLKPTLIGGIMGGVLGGMAPGAIGASFSFLTTTVGLSGGIAGSIITTTSISFAYFSTAAANRNWSPLEWNWSSPATWNALFSGGISGATFYSGIGAVHRKYLALNGLEKVLFVKITVVSTTSLALATGAYANNGNLAFWEWDWKNPDTLWKSLMGISMGITISPRMPVTHITQVSKEILLQLKLLRTGDMKSIESAIPNPTELLKVAQRTWNEFKKMSMSLNTYGPLPIVFLAGAKDPRSESSFDMLKSIIFESSKYSPLRNVTEDLVTGLDDLSGLQQQNSFRNRRDIKCCQLQPMTFTISNSHLSNKSVPDSQFNFMKSAGFKENPVFQNLFIYIKNYFKQVFKYHSASVINTDLNYPSMAPEALKTVLLRYCYHIETSNQNIHVQCYGKDGRYTIYPKTDTMKHFTGDFYSRCTPLEYQGQPSVACDGKDTSMLFTSSRHDNILDHINGLLMLAFVVPGAIANIKNGLRSLFTWFTQKRSKSTNITTEIDNLEKKYTNLYKCVESAKSSIDNKFHWIDYCLEDISDDIALLRENSYHADINCIIDRIESLQEEVIETLIITYLPKETCSFSFPGVVYPATILHGLNSIHEIPYISHQIS